MNKLLTLSLLYLLISCSSTNNTEKIDPLMEDPVSKEQILFAELLSEKSKIEAEEVQVELLNDYYFGKLKSEEEYSICISEENYASNPKATYIKLINMSDIEQFEMFMQDSIFHAPFKNGTLHSIEFKSENRIITQLKTFEGRLMTLRSYKKETDQWKMISAGFYYYKEEYVHPFN